MPMSGSSVLECTALRLVEKSSIRFIFSGPLRGIIGEEWLLLCLGNSYLWAEIEKFDVLNNLKSLFCFLESCLKLLTLIEPS